MATETLSSKRITARVPKGLKRTLQEAADLIGTPLNQFVVQAAYAEAQRLIERETVIRLSRDSARKVFELIENPPKPNAALKKAARDFKRTIRVRD